MGGEDVEEGAAILREAGIPTFPYPDTAVKLFNDTWRFADNLQAALRDADARRRDEEPSTAARAVAIIERPARRAGRS